MCKKVSTQKSVPSSTLPLPPCIYINDPKVDSTNALELSSVIPTSWVFYRRDGPGAEDDLLTCLTSKSKQAVPIFTDNKGDDEHGSKINYANELRKATIQHGCNFVSINLYTSDGTSPSDKAAWGTNHLDLSTADSSPKETADKIYKWLFTVLTIPETLYLISHKEMHAIDTKSFSDYAYCAIADSRNHRKDAKIQFVVLITSKPVVGPGQKLTWTVADRSGVANFYFQHRGPECQYTWDWVLALKPGDRRALPRMPCVEVVERRSLRIVKSPARGAAALLGGVGLLLAAMARGLSTASDKVRDNAAGGRARQWVPEADVAAGKRGAQPSTTKTTTTKATKQEREIQVFDEKGAMLWRDWDSIASTRNASLVDVSEKKTDEF